MNEIRNEINKSSIFLDKYYIQNNIDPNYNTFSI